MFQETIEEIIQTGGIYEPNVLKLRQLGKNADEAIDRLTKDNGKLQKDNGNLQRDNKNLQTEIGRVKGDVNKIRWNYEEIERDNYSLKKSFEQANSKLNNIKLAGGWVGGEENPKPSLLYIVGLLSNFFTVLLAIWEIFIIFYKRYGQEAIQVFVPTEGTEKNTVNSCLKSCNVLLANVKLCESKEDPLDDYSFALAILGMVVFVLHMFYYFISMCCCNSSSSCSSENENVNLNNLKYFGSTNNKDEEKENNYSNFKNNFKGKKTGKI
jgi:hypothetical protein